MKFINEMRNKQMPYLHDFFVKQLNLRSKQRQNRDFGGVPNRHS